MAIIPCQLLHSTIMLKKEINNNAPYDKYLQKEK